MKNPRIVFFAILIFGLIFLIVGTFVCLSVFDYSDTAETAATITKIEQYKDVVAGKYKIKYKTHITYEVDGQIYNEVMQNYSSSWEEGDEIIIHYDINDPKKTGTKQTDYALIVIPCLGVVFACIGGIALFVYNKKRS